MKLNGLFVVLTIVSLALSACGATAAPATAAPSAATSAPVVVPPTSVPATDIPTSAPAAAGAKVTIAGFAFSPSTLEVKVGATVTWTNNDNMTHTVVADDGSFKSDALDQGASFSFTFDKAGSYAYHCGIHSSMKATITVAP